MNSFSNRALKPITKKVAARLNGLHKEFNRSRSLTEISTLLGIPKSTYNSYLRGLALPPVPIAKKILNLTMNNTNDLEWLYYGDIVEYIGDYLRFRGFEKLLNIYADFPHLVYLTYDIENCGIDPMEEVTLSDHEIDIYFEKILIEKLCL